MDRDLIREQMKQVKWEVIAADPFEFRFAFRQIGEDRGPTLEVYAVDGAEKQELLKFDGFEKRPHWHRCRTGEKDTIINREASSFEQELAFAMEQLTQNFGSLISEQGFGRLASSAVTPNVRSAVAEVEQKMHLLVAAQMTAP